MFRDKFNKKLPGATVDQMQTLRAALHADIGVSELQIVESVAYSMAMVIRVALGLSAEQGSVGVLYTDTLPGWIALASARHLLNAGSNVHLVECGDISNASSLLQQLKQPLRFLKAIDSSFQQLRLAKEVIPFLASCHNVVTGISPMVSNEAETEKYQSIVRTLNENSIPVHAIEAPIGIDLDSGVAIASPLYASSTLSLGIPYHGLAAAHEYVGRHYLADISLPLALLNQTLGGEFPTLFAEQPVIQIFPDQEEPL